MAKETSKPKKHKNSKIRDQKIKSFGPIKESGLNRAQRRELKRREKGEKNGRSKSESE